MGAVRNIIFITVDQWRGECLSLRGHAHVRTPHLDALAREGVAFINHFANAAPCAPSRASLHTGLYLHNHRVAMNGTPLDQRHTNWALEMRKAGYRPALIGYTDQTPDPRGLARTDPRLFTYEGVLPGLDEIAFAGMEKTGPWQADLLAKNYPAEAKREMELLSLRAPGPDWEDGASAPRPWVIKSEDGDTAFLINRAKEFISSQASARDVPGFVLHLSILKPHPPFVASEPWNARHDPAMVDGFVRAPSLDAEGAMHPWLAYQVANPLYHPPENEKRLRRLKAVYYGLMEETDHYLGALFAHLKQAGLWDDTAIIVTSDHGEQMGDRHLIGKCGWFDESFHVPLIIRDPRGPKALHGRVVDAFTENVDIMPTLLSLLQLEVPPACDGRNLSPWLSGDTPRDWRKHAYWEYDFRDAGSDHVEKALGIAYDACHLAVLRGHDFKYVHFASLPPLFFDRMSDPQERVNRADDPAFAPRVMAAMRALLSHRMLHEDRTLTHLRSSPLGLMARR